MTVTVVVSNLIVAHCRRDLGMNSREVPDSAITASSAYDDRSVGAINARSPFFVYATLIVSELC